ncbi:hypothetical protein KM043_009474 [Ampulex compressa]|nr:hypothetical protein KM043_009474 [Ampulex compressa]
MFLWRSIIREIRFVVSSKYSTSPEPFDEVKPPQSVSSREDNRETRAITSACLASTRHRGCASRARRPGPPRLAAGVPGDAVDVVSPPSRGTAQLRRDAPLRQSGIDRRSCPPVPFNDPQLVAFEGEYQLGEIQEKEDSCIVHREESDTGRLEVVRKRWSLPWDVLRSRHWWLIIGEAFYPFDCPDDPFVPPRGRSSRPKNELPGRSGGLIGKRFDRSTAPKRAPCPSLVLRQEEKGRCRRTHHPPTERTATPTLAAGPPRCKQNRGGRCGAELTPKRRQPRRNTDFARVLREEAEEGLPWRHSPSTFTFGGSSERIDRGDEDLDGWRVLRGIALEELCWKKRGGFAEYSLEWCLDNLDRIKDRGFTEYSTNLYLVNFSGRDLKSTLGNIVFCVLVVTYTLVEGVVS